MKKNLLLFIIVILSVFFTTPAFCANASASTYKFVPLKDSKTKIEFARTIVPESFSVNSEIFWARDYEEPVLILVSAENKNKDVLFFYSSIKSYVDVSSDKFAKSHEGKMDPTLRVSRKKFLTPKDYIFETVSTTNPNAKDFKLVKSESCSPELSEYLTREFYNKLSDMESSAKIDTRTSKTKLTNHKVEPYMATYTFTENGKKYKQTFITMFSSVDYNYTNKSSYDEYQNITKKFWTNYGFYSYRVEEKDYDKYLDDFIIFVANSMVNTKAKEAIKSVKIQMIMELNPSFVDIHTGSPLKNMPSELFRRYYIGGAPDYSEDVPMQKPSVEHIRWYSNLLFPQTGFGYKKITNLWKQKVYVPQKYQYVYYNTISQTLLISDKKQDTSGLWTKLKPVKIDYSKE